MIADVEFTDGSTDSEAEATAINEGSGRGKKKKRVLRTLPDAKHVAAKLKESKEEKKRNAARDAKNKEKEDQAA